MRGRARKHSKNKKGGGELAPWLSPGLALRPPRLIVKDVPTDLVRTTIAVAQLQCAH